MLDASHRALLPAAFLEVLGLFLVAFVPLDVGPQSVEYFTIGLILGTIFGCTTLAATWTALGPLRFSFRMPLAICWLATLVGALAVNMAVYQRPTPDAVFLVMLSGCLLAQWGLVQLPLWGLAYGFGLQLRRGSCFRTTDVIQRRQFGIRQLMQVTASIAVVLGIGRMVVLRLIANDLLRLDREAPIFLFLAVAGVAMTVPLVLAVLLPRHAIPASLVVLVLIALGTQLEVPLLQATTTQRGGGPDAWHFFWINAFQAAWVLAVLSVLRCSGYELTSGHPSAAGR